VVKFASGRIVLSIKGLLLDEFPGPFDEVEVGGIWGGETGRDPRFFGTAKDKVAVLIPGIIEDDMDGYPGCGIVLLDLFQKGADGFSVDVIVIGKDSELVRNGVDSAQHIDAVAPCGGRQEEAHL